MARIFWKAFFVVCIGALIMGCGGAKPQRDTNAGAAAVQPANAAGSMDVSGDGSGVMLAAAGDNEMPPALDTYMETVDNFLVILDASGSKFLPYSGQIKLKIAKDILRRFNARVPSRPLTGALRRYGFEAGAFSEPTELLYGVGPYSRPAYADAIEVVRWAGGKSPMAMAIDAASDDLSSVAGNMALVIISDGKIYQGDPVEAARRMKQRYGDRLCIYTALVGDLPYGKVLMQQAADVGECGYMVTADDLAPDGNMDQWVDDIFNRTRRFQPRQVFRVADAAPCPDADNDGVCDGQDACPGTPIGARVDARGCWDIGKVQFIIDRHNIQPQYYPVIDEVARVMSLNPGLKIKVQGHTCTIASEKYNMKLSYNRAIAVSDYLLKKGIPSERIAVEGFGFHRPAASNQTEEGRDLNRRAEFEPVKPVR